MNIGYHRASDLLPQARAELANPAPGMSLPWWPELNRQIGGLRAGEFTVLCAPTGAGKTTLIANIAAQVAVEQSIPTFVAPVETGDVNFVIRVQSALAASDYDTGLRYSEDRLVALDPINERIKRAPLYIASYDGKVDIDDMEGMLRYQRASNGVRLALLDNLNYFLEASSAGEANLVMDRAIRSFVNVTKELGVHVILVCHPKKTDGGRVSSEFDIKGSSTIVQECFNVALWNRKAEADANHGPTDRELVFRKMRKRGNAVGRPFWFSYQGTRFFEITDVSGMRL